MPLAERQYNSEVVQHVQMKRLTVTRLLSPSLPPSSLPVACLRIQYGTYPESRRH